MADHASRDVGREAADSRCGRLGRWLFDHPSPRWKALCLQGVGRGPNWTVSDGSLGSHCRETRTFSAMHQRGTSAYRRPAASAFVHCVLGLLEACVGTCRGSLHRASSTPASVDVVFRSGSITVDILHV